MSYKLQVTSPHIQRETKKKAETEISKILKQVEEDTGLTVSFAFIGRDDLDNPNIELTLKL